MSVAVGQAVTVDDVTSKWLTEALRQAGALPTGRVAAIETRRNKTFNSHIFHLKPTYSADAPASAPAGLLLKCSLPAAWAQRAGARETAFYQMVQSLPDHPEVIVRCYDAVYDEASGNSHILLEDLSASHLVPVERAQQISLVDNLPSNTHLVQAVDMLARFHAYWWQHPQLGTGGAQVGAWWRDETHVAAETMRRRHAWEELIAHERAWFPTHLVTIYERILDQLLHLWQSYMQPRLANFQHLTLTHGDAYLANFLCPRPGNEGNAYIIDWQSPEVYQGASDLVTMCATSWTRKQRAEDDRELNVLRRYHCTLQENGVRGYAWGDLVRDYQLALVDWLLVPLQDRLEGASQTYWWPKMQCLAHAFEDWHVDELFIDQ